MSNVFDLLSTGSPVAIMTVAIGLLWRRFEKLNDALQAEKALLHLQLQAANEARHVQAEAHSAKLEVLAKQRHEEGVTTGTRIEAERAVIEGLRDVLAAFSELLDTRRASEVHREEERHAQPTKPRR